MLTPELEKIENKKQSLVPEEKIYPWQLCPIGKYFVSTYTS
jgi:hypothetical protein